VRLPDYLHPVDAEISVIGAAFIDPASVARSGCMPGDFGDPAHGVVWSAVQHLAAHGQPIDATSVTTLLEAREQVRSAGGYDAIGELVDGAGSALNVEHHAGIVRQAADARRAYSLVTRMGPAMLEAMGIAASEGRLADGTRRALSTIAAETVAALSGATASSEWVTMRAAKRAAIERAHSRYEAWRSDAGRPDDLLPTGLESLDAEIGGGLEAGHMCVIDGATGAGKTALMLRIARAMAAHLCSVDPDPAVSGIVAYYSCEVPGADLAVRDLSTASGVDGLDLRSGRLQSHGALDRLMGAAGPAAGDIHLRIGFRPSAPVEWLVSEVALLEETVGPVRAIVIDHWNDLTTHHRARSDEREFAHIAATLDALKAGTVKCPAGRVVVVGAQHKADGLDLLWATQLRMRMSYRWSWRVAGKGLPDGADGCRALIKRIKSRNGPLGDTWVRWGAKTGRIEDE